MNRRYQRLSLSRLSPFWLNQSNSNQHNLTQHESNQMLVFEERRKLPEYPEKNLSEQSRETTNSAHIWRESGNRTRATLVEGECSDTAPTLLPINIIIIIIIITTRVIK